MFLRYMKWMPITTNNNQIAINEDNWQEQRCVSDKISIIGFQMKPAYQDWFDAEVMPQIRGWHARTFGMEGSLLSLMSKPKINKTAQLFSALVYGMGFKSKSMWTFGRMEWLALELVAEARELLRETTSSSTNEHLWSILAREFNRERSDIEISIAFAPHKMRLLGEELESSAPGAGERSDILLLACPTGASKPTIIGCAYHTTCLPEHCFHEVWTGVSGNTPALAAVHTNARAYEGGREQASETP